MMMKEMGGYKLAWDWIGGSPWTLESWGWTGQAHKSRCLVSFYGEMLMLPNPCPSSFIIPDPDPTNRTF